MFTSTKSPTIRTPLTDFSIFFEGYCVQGSFRMLCRRIEMEYLKCLQAYGTEKGYQKCHDYRDDLNECFTGRKQKSRVEEMRRERERQYKEGKLEKKFEDRPPNDSIYDINI